MMQYALSNLLFQDCYCKPSKCFYSAILSDTTLLLLPQEISLHWELILWAGSLNHYVFQKFRLVICYKSKT